MRVAVLSSGGKDSTYASWWAQLQGWEVVSLVTVLVRGEDSMMFQLQNTWIAAFQASSIGVPWKPVLSNGETDEEMSELELAIRGEGGAIGIEGIPIPENVELPKDLALHNDSLDIDALVVGALRSDYQKTKIERMCERLGIASFCPLWHKVPESHMRSLLEHGFRVVFTSVSTEGMCDRWVGSTLEWDSLDDLIGLAEDYRFNLDGEGGEFETIVVSAPHMRSDIKLDGEVVWDGTRGSLKVISCSLSGNR